MPLPSPFCTNQVVRRIQSSRFQSVQLLLTRSFSSLDSELRDYSHVKKVGIIGGGVAGLQMARSLKQQGFKCTVYERSSECGGLWRENYSGCGLQAPKQLYEFPDFGFKKARWGEFADLPQVREYIHDFVQHFELKPDLRLNSTVTKISTREDGKRGWTFSVEDSSTQKASTEVFDFAVVATGMYSSPPFIPDMQGSAAFQGSNTILHSSEFTDRDLAKDKNVVVVGGAKSAIDVVLESSKVARTSTMLYRNAHWGTPRKLAGLIPFQYVFLSRFGQCLISLFKGVWPEGDSKEKEFLKKWREKSFMSSVMGGIFSIVEALFAFQLKHYGSFRPKMDVVQDFFGYAHVLSSEFRDKVSKGDVQAMQGEIDHLCSDGVVVKALNGEKETLKCDLLLCATGFSKSYDYLPQEVIEKLDIESDGLWLYRHIVSPNVPDLAFCGSEVATVCNITTHGIQAEWITRMLQGRFSLPSANVMREHVEEMKEWKRSWMPFTPSRAAIILLYQIHYHDTLLNDMNIQRQRKKAKAGSVVEYLAPYQSADYDCIVGKP